ncbi:hypothetical protein H4R20_003052 [Coemansia guatemalensis]|uniref:Cation efflux protein transmembrane domain-containing protein n=1 Tax=Coemansia guatemalensis TaxID=2761395 RepID=A0A9W8I1C3_9FUNG|nr:hypothetical protein H4R20_003052 [Coemansia guatemalensis]
MSRVFHDAYGHASEQLSASGQDGVSWWRLWRVLFSDHRFLGVQLYVSVLHLCLGVGVWAAGIYVESLALMCYAFVVMYDAVSLFIALVPRILEYSGNRHWSAEYPFGLQILPTLLEFTNNITLLYRGVQALKEGAEHLIISGHEHSTAIEFETYALRGKGHNHGAALGFVCVLAAMLVTGYSATRFANHHAMWEVRSRQRQLISGMQNIVLNPLNVCSLFAGLWMLVMLVLSSNAEETVIEPASCILVAAIMAFVSLPTCMRLGRLLLHAVPTEIADDVQRTVQRVSRLPGVVDCESYRMWGTAHDCYTVALRVSVDPECCANGNVLHRHIASLLKSSGMGDWSIEIRTA